MVQNSFLSTAVIHSSKVGLSKMLKKRIRKGHAKVGWCSVEQRADAAYARISPQIQIGDEIGIYRTLSTGNILATGAE